jgi:maleylpyruvate isomerase
MQLYSFFRSSAAYRVRIALNLKGLSYETLSVNLARDGTEPFRREYRKIHPAVLVPALADQGQVLTESLAIIEYLDEIHPQPPMLPPDPLGRARVRGIAQAIACDTHPLQVQRVANYLKDRMGQDEQAVAGWRRHWVSLGLDAVERMLAQSPATGRYCHGDAPTLADACLVPQVANARRFGCDFAGLPTVARIDAACREHPAFQAAAPDRQPDAE